MPELRITVVIADDLDTEQVVIRAMGDSMLPAPITASTFEEAWSKMGTALDGYRKAPPKRWA